MILKRRYVICFSPTRKNQEQRKLYFVSKSPVRYVPYMQRAKHFVLRQDAKRVLRGILRRSGGTNPYWRHGILALLYRDDEGGGDAVLWDIEDEPERSEHRGQSPHPAHQDVPSRSHCNTGRP